MPSETRVDADRWTFTAVVEPNTRDGEYVVRCRALKGCWSQGETVEEARQRSVDAISGWLAVCIEQLLLFL